MLVSDHPQPNVEIDRKTLVFALETWKASTFVADAKITSVLISPSGQLVNHNERLDPENDAERWVTFHTNIAKYSPVAQNDLTPLHCITGDGRISGCDWLDAGAFDQPLHAWVPGRTRK